MSSQPSGEEVVKIIREEAGPRTLLSFSRGKDSIGAYVAIRDTFEVTPYHLILVPGLEFVEESLAYYETIMGRIVRLPHPSLYRWLNNDVFLTPGHSAVVRAARLPDFDYRLIHNLVAAEVGLDGDAVFTATGVRAVDSPMRMTAMKVHGPINRTRRVYYPVYDWRKAKLEDEIRRSGIKLPVDYLWFGRSFDGIDLRFVYPLKKKRPKDYQRVLEWFPLVEAEVWRYERFGNAKAGNH